MSVYQAALTQWRQDPHASGNSRGTPAAALTALGQLRVPADAAAAVVEGFAPASGRLLLLVMVPLRELLDDSQVVSPAGLAGPRLLAAIARPCLGCMGCFVMGSDAWSPSAEQQGH